MTSDTSRSLKAELQLVLHALLQCSRRVLVPESRLPPPLAALEWKVAWKSTFPLLFGELSRRDLQQGNEAVAGFIINEMVPFTITASFVSLLN